MCCFSYCVATCKRVAEHGSKTAEAKNYILLHFQTLFLPCTISSSSSSSFFFFCTLFSSKWLSALFIFQIWYLFGLLFLSYAFAFSWNMVCPVHCSWDLQVHFSQKIILKIGLMVLFIYLKNILLHLKMVCIRLQIKKSVYFTIQLIFATIYGSHCIFCYYS